MMINKLKELKNKRAIKIMMMVLKAIMSLLIVAIVSVIFVQRVSSNNVTIGGYRIFTIVTESMVPKYQVGDMIISKTVDVSSIKLEDDMVYMGKKGDFKDKIVTHQVIDIEVDKDGVYSFHTKGLANVVEDPIVYEDQVYGVVMHKFVILSFLSKILNNTYSFYFLVFVPFVVLLFFEIVDVVHDKEGVSKKLKNKDK